MAVLVLLIGGGTWTATVGTAPFWLPVAAVLGIAALATRLRATSATPLG